MDYSKDYLDGWTNGTTRGFILAQNFLLAQAQEMRDNPDKYDEASIVADAIEELAKALVSD